MVLFLPLAEEENYFLPSFFSHLLWSWAAFRRSVKGEINLLALGHESNAAPKGDAQAEEAPVPAPVCPLWLECFPRGFQLLFL